MKFATRAIHEGQPPDPTTGAVITPIYQTSTYAQEGLGKHKGYEYSRTANPTRTALETCLASLEEGHFGLAFASGMAATTAVLSLFKPGDHIVAAEDLYGGTYRLFEQVLRPQGYEFTFVAAPRPENVRAALRPNTRLIWIETPSNPLLSIIDIPAVAEIASRHSSRPFLAVDNTFATPLFQRPLALGAHIVVHSTTKYLGGHSDVVGGAVITSDEGVCQRVKFYQNAAGAVPGPFDCWLVLRGLKTLAVRMPAHERGAFAVAEYLQSHPRVERVYYPGLSSHPHHGLAKKQMSGFSGIVSAALRADGEGTRAFLSRVRLFTLGESLGGVESLVTHPSTMTHASFSPEERARRGITDSLVRFSIGIEDPEDLVEDLRKALV